MISAQYPPKQPLEGQVFRAARSPPEVAGDVPGFRAGNRGVHAQEGLFGSYQAVRSIFPSRGPPTIYSFLWMSSDTSTLDNSFPRASLTPTHAQKHSPILTI